MNREKVRHCATTFWVETFRNGNLLKSQEWNYKRERMRSRKWWIETSFDLDKDCKINKTLKFNSPQNHFAFDLLNWRKKNECQIVNSNFSSEANALTVTTSKAQGRKNRKKKNSPKAYLEFRMIDLLKLMLPSHSTWQFLSTFHSYFIFVLSLSWNSVSIQI